MALLWLEGLLLAGAAFLLFRWVFSRTEAAPAGTLSAPSRLHWLAAAAVAAAGTALRISFAADVPPAPGATSSMRSSPSSGTRFRPPGSGAIPHPIVFETLSSPADPAVAVRRLPRESSGELLIAPPRSPFWYVATEGALARLRRAGWRVGRGTGARIPSQEGPVIARVVPPSSAPR